MTTQREVREVINEAGEAYARCVRTLVDLRRARPTDDLVRFQSVLGRSLYKLSSAYADISAIRADLIRRKDRLSREWFRGRQRSLSGMQRVLKEALAVGRSIGDSYAWFFYQFDQELLAAHQREPAQLIFPTGVGGMGELGFVDNLPRIGDYLVLHHGITSMLRLGDVTLIDMKGLSVVGVAELKSKQEGEGQFRVHAEFILKSKSAADTMTMPTTQRESRRLDPVLTQRLKQQTERIVEAIRPPPEPDETRRLGTDIGFPADDLEDLLRVIRTGGRCAWRRIGEGLLVVALRLPQRTLFTRLTTPRIAELVPDVVVREAERLMLAGSDYNHINIGSPTPDLAAGEGYLPGGMPMFWWPVDPTLLEPVMLRGTAVVTIYNPAHLLAKLEKIGFTVRQESPGGRLHFERQAGDRLMKLQNIEFFFQQVQDHLYSEDRVVATLGAVIDQLPRPTTEADVLHQVELRFNQVLDPPDDPDLLVP